MPRSRPKPTRYQKKKHADRQKQLYNDRIRNKQCGKCGIQDELTLNGSSYCSFCRDKNRARRRRYYATDYGKKMNLLRQRDYMADLKERGVCIRCKKNNAEPGRAYCAECISAYTEYNHKYLAKKKKEKLECST